MQTTVTCINCGQVVPANPRLKTGQSYCNDKACQNVRKKQWYQQNLAADPAYAERQKECKKQWQKNKPGHLYQKQYRQANPDYVEKNRIQQKLRNQNRQKTTAESDVEKIVKIDTSGPETEKTTLYQMTILTPNVSGKIVKIDTLLVQIQKYQGPVSGKYLEL